ncbi:MAG TPA: hypothetical protein DDZ41_03370, partial [Flavobacterium sp.]|nr:hypothetical protein [Flavobacterium sp.]
MINYASEIDNYYPEITQTIGNSFVDNRNINHTSGSDFQDFKRAIVVVFIKKDNKWKRGSGELVNTIQNSFEGSKRKFYILTAHHVADYDDIFISFNYEIPHATDRGSDLVNSDITKVYKIAYKTKILDQLSDLALLEVDYEKMSMNPTEYEKPETVFYNTYALGWDLNPKFIKENLLNISHPRGDVKKVFVSPKELYFTSTFKLDGFGYDFTNKRLIMTDKTWNNAAFPQRGSSGSPLMDKNAGKVSAVLSNGMITKSGERGLYRFSSITNSWIDNDLIQGFKNFLDPQETWISNVSGGYVQDLIPNLQDIDFDFNVSPQKAEKTIKSLSTIDFFRFELEESHNEKKLGNGILLHKNQILNQDQTITLDLHASNDDLLYRANYNDGVNSQSTLFKGSTDNKYIKTRMYFKNQLLQHLRNVNNAYFASNNGGNTIIGAEKLRTFEIKNVKISLSANTGTAKVRAIKLPDMMPYNAVELFEPSRFANLWRSYKY